MQKIIFFTFLRRCMLLAFLLPTFSIFESQAQNKTGNNYINRIMTLIPDSLTYSTDKIAGYIGRYFATDKDKSRAIFVWISRNIEYNFDSILTNSIYETPSEVSERILRTRTGVCLNFAHLFNELSNKSGIKSYIIHGYTKQNGRVDYLPHIWCASLIDTTWYLFDPTWGSGYVSRGHYVHQVNGYYFMAHPERLIRSHMPFDPLWQFLDYPITHHEFGKGGYKRDTTRLFFNYMDTLQLWESATELERAKSVARRIEQSGVTNAFVAAKLRVVKGEAEYLSNKRAAGIYDTAVTYYNQGIRVFNRFIGYRNEQINDSLLLSSLLDTSEVHFDSAIQLLSDADAVDQNIISSVNSLKNAIEDTRRMLNLQRAAFISHLKTRSLNKY